VYKKLASFEHHMDEYVRAALREGPHGWEVTDCSVTMTQCAYSVPDGPPSKRGPLSTAADFRKLTPLVLSQALRRGGTVVCEPIVRVVAETPTTSIAAVIAALTRLGASVEGQVAGRELSTVDAVMSAQGADGLQRELARLTSGEGVLDSVFAGYRPLGATAR
jgi:ribosomal protection tetracycline resistance protein